MSVIIKDKDKSGKDVIRMFTKGAESIIYERLAPGQEAMLRETDHQVCAYAFEGLRCLVIAHADIDSAAYSNWRSRYTKAKTDLNEIDKKKKGIIIIIITIITTIIIITIITTTTIIIIIIITTRY